MKTCTLCGEPQPEENFYKNAAAKDSLSSHCKDCAYIEHTRAWRQMRRQHGYGRRRWIAQQLKQRIQLNPRTPSMQRSLVEG